MADSRRIWDFRAKYMAGDLLEMSPSTSHCMGKNHRQTDRKETADKKKECGIYGLQDILSRAVMNARSTALLRKY